jgi:hypothetical protein
MIYTYILDYSWLHLSTLFILQLQQLLINQYIDHQSSRVLRAALSSTSLIACTRSALCVLGGRQMPFGQTRCTLTCMQALTALHLNYWPLQSRTNLQDGIDYARITKNRTFCCSNVVNIDYAGTTENRTFYCSNLVNIDYAGTNKNRTLCCSNLVKSARNTKLKHFFIQKHKQLYIVPIITLLQTRLFEGTSLQ